MTYKKHLSEVENIPKENISLLLRENHTMWLIFVPRGSKGSTITLLSVQKLLRIVASKNYMLLSRSSKNAPNTIRNPAKKNN